MTTMANGQDNSGKPPAGPGMPRIAPAVPAANPAPRVTVAPNVPLVPQVTPAGARPPSAPPGARPPGVAPAAAVPPRGVAPAPGVPPVAARPPGVAPAVPPGSRPGVPAVAPARPGVPPGAPPMAAPARPGAPLVPPAQAARPGAPVVPPAAPARPGAPLVPPAPMAARPGAPLVPPAPPQAPAAPFIPPRPGAAPAAPAAAAQRIGPLPPSGPVDTITPQQAAGLRRMADALDKVDYFEALGVPQSATPADIKKAFYRESRTYHPDRFFHLPESQVKEDIVSIYKRMTEAYYVLRDDAKRRKYLADVTGPDRANKLRYTEATESELKAEARKSVEEEFGTNPKARPFFKTALAEFEKGNWTAAVSAFKTGLMYEPGNTRFKEKLAEAQAKVEENRKSSSSFMIK